MRRFIVTAGSGFAFAFLACAVPAGGAAAAGIELPPHRPGLWEMSMALDGKGQGLTMQRCTD
ncbi:MAG: hypothetical protein J0H62_00975, partial [Rhizobiales bacterium]|nr:hypothetical protein [Hyphomicrobiales bacterium]